MYRLFLVCAGILVALSLPAAAEVQVNVRTSGAQANSAVAVDPRGGAVVVWSSYYSTAGRSNDILARRLDRTGAPAGDEFLVNALSEGNQTEPAVAIDSRGPHGVRLAGTWAGRGYSAADVRPAGRSRHGRSAREPGRRRPTALSMHRNGRRRMHSSSPGRAGRRRSTAIRPSSARISSTRTAPGWATRSSSIPDIYDCRYPDLAMDAGGNFVVTWMRDRSNHPIMARLFDPNGVPLTDPFEVNTIEHRLRHAAVDRDEFTRPFPHRLGRRPQPGQPTTTSTQGSTTPTARPGASRSS